MKAKFDLKFLGRPVTLNNLEIQFGFRKIYITHPELAGPINAEKNDLTYIHYYLLQYFQQTVEITIAICRNYHTQK